MEKENRVYNSIKDIPDSAWNKLVEKSIYFGHQSVGGDILEGVRDLMNEYPQIKLNIIETASADEFKKPLFAHSKIGKNTEPDLKCSDFRNILDGGIGGKADIAFYKFCYVDIDGKTDVEKLFKTYKETREAVRQKHPRLTVVHCTTPLTTVQTGWKASIKKLLGKPVDGYGENIKRNLFNQKLLAEYNGKEPIYDLAGIESSGAGTMKTTFELDGKVYNAMNLEYTSDGGHLNPSGRRIAAAQLLILLVNLSQ